MLVRWPDWRPKQSCACQTKTLIRPLHINNDKVTAERCTKLLKDTHKSLVTNKDAQILRGGYFSQIQIAFISSGIITQHFYLFTKNYVSALMCQHVIINYSFNIAYHIISSTEIVSRGKYKPQSNAWNAKKKFFSVYFLVLEFRSELSYVHVLRAHGIVSQQPNVHLTSSLC